MRKIKNLVRFLALAGLVIGVWAPSLAPVLAAAGEGISIAPAITKEYPTLRSWFVYEAAPNTEVKDKVELINNTSKAVTLLVVALDGAVTSDGGYTLVAAADENKDLGTWITLGSGEVSLPPKSRKVIDMTIKVPENADVGSHPGGVVVLKKPEATGANQNKGSMLSVVTRVGARVYLTVPGDIKRVLDIKKISHQVTDGVLYFRAILENNGNVQLTPEADISVRGWFGKLGTQAKVPFGLILRGTTITGRAPWNGKQPIFGRYVADFRFQYGEKDFKGEYVKEEYTDARYVFWVMPWSQIFIWVGLILLLIFLRNLWLWLIIQQRLNTRAKKHVVKKGETLTMIAAAYLIHPRKLAKFNLLKWPYELTLGDTLLIPQGKMSKLERLEMGREWNSYYKAEQRKALLTDVRFIGRLFGKIRLRRRGATAGAAKKVVNVPSGATEALIAEKGDTIYDIAEFSGVSIEKVAQLNNLRPPYRLRAGQEVLVPIKRQALSKPQSAAKRHKSIKKPK